MRTYPIRLSKKEGAELERRARSRAGRADDARIARVLLLLAEGVTYREIAGRVDCSEPFISKWKKRFVAERLAGLYVRHEGRPVTVLTPKVEARILNWTRKKPTDGSTHWSTRAPGQEARRPPHDGGSDLEEARDPATPDGALHGVQRPRVRGEGRRCDRALSQSPATCRGALRGRENGYPGAGPQRSGSAPVARQGGAARFRVHPPRHSLALRRARHSDRRGSWQDHRSPYQPGVCGLP